MIYARSAALDDLGLVVLDEVHFLQDAYRGPVWEEVIVHLPMDVQLVCLSATVSNAAEIAEWMTTVRGRHRVCRRGTAPGSARQPVPRRRQDHRAAAPAADHRRWRARTRRRPGSTNEAARGWKGWAATPQGRGGKLYTPSAVGGRRTPRARGDAPGDLLHLQPQPVRRGGPSRVWPPALRLTTGERARPDPRDRRDHAWTASSRRDLAVLGYGAVRGAARGWVSPPITPAWCRRSKRSSRRASPRV